MIRKLNLLAVWESRPKTLHVTEIRSVVSRIITHRQTWNITRSFHAQNATCVTSIHFHMGFVCELAWKCEHLIVSICCLENFLLDR
jgi:hypothetical protein